MQELDQSDHIQLPRLRLKFYRAQYLLQLQLDPSLSDEPASLLIKFAFAKSLWLESQYQILGPHLQSMAGELKFEHALGHTFYQVHLQLIELPQLMLLVLSKLSLHLGEQIAWCHKLQLVQ